MAVWQASKSSLDVVQPCVCGCKGYLTLQISLRLCDLFTCVDILSSKTPKHRVPTRPCRYPHKECLCPLLSTMSNPETPPPPRNAYEANLLHFSSHYHSPATPANHPKLRTVTVAIPNMKPIVCLSIELNAPLHVAHVQSANGV